MADVIVRRKLDSVGVYRNLEVLIDDEVVGALRRGAELRLTLPYGPHVVQGRMDWATSRAVRLDLQNDCAVVAVAYNMTALVKTFLDPKNAIDIEIEQGVEGPPVDGQPRPKAYWPRIMLAALFVAVLFWLGRTGTVPMGVNVAAQILFWALAVYVAVRTFRLMRNLNDTP